MGSTDDDNLEGSVLILNAIRPLRNVNKRTLREFLSRSEYEQHANTSSISRFAFRMPHGEIRRDACIANDVLKLRRIDFLKIRRLV